MANTPLMFQGVPIVFDDKIDTGNRISFMGRDGVKGLSGKKSGMVIIDDVSSKPPQIVSDEYLQKYAAEALKTMARDGQVWTKHTPYRNGDIVSRVLRPAEYRWHEVSAGIGLNPAEFGRTQISAEEALNNGLDIPKLVPVSLGSNFYYKPQKEYPVAKAVRAKKVKEVEYNTVGVRFLDGQKLAKVYTYLVPKKAKLHLGQEVIVPTDKTGSGYITSSVAVVVRFDKEKQDLYGYDQFITGTIKPL